MAQQLTNTTMQQECDESKRNFLFRKKWMGKVLRCQLPYNFRLDGTHDTRTVEGPVIAIQEVQRRKRNPTGSVIIQAHSGISGEVTVLPGRCEIITD